MKLEFDVDPRMVRLVILSLLLLCGVHYQDIILLAGL